MKIIAICFSLTLCGFSCENSIASLNKDLTTSINAYLGLSSEMIKRTQEAMKLRMEVLNSVNNKIGLLRKKNFIIVESFDIQNDIYFGEIIVDQDEFYSFRQSEKDFRKIELEAKHSFSEKVVQCLIKWNLECIKMDEKIEGNNFDANSHIVSQVNVNKSGFSFKHFEFSDYPSSIGN